jgi:NADPH2:quinone reductase
LDGPVRAIRVSRAGGPEVLEPTDLPDPVPGPGELLVEVAAAGVNFIDTYRRSGVYPTPVPHVPGGEGAGRVVAVGAVSADGPAPDGASHGPAVGDRVAWHDAPGSYAELVLVRAATALRVPDGVDDEVAAATPLQGMTAHYLVTSTFPVRAGQVVLVHAAAGGTGLLLTQLAAARGARVVGTVSTAEKEALARAAGAAEVIRYTELGDLATELPAAVRDLTGGAGVHAVYDGVGADTFDASLACLRVRGTLVLFGGSSGQVPPVDLQRLNAGGSLFVTRPSLGHHVSDPDELRWRASEVFGAVADGSLRVRVGGRYPLAEAARAHADLEGRRTTGKLLLLPR